MPDHGHPNGAVEEAKPVFILSMTVKGGISWQSKLPIPTLLFALERIKLELLTGQVKTQDEPAIVGAQPGDVEGLKRRMNPH